ncbi:MAG TPA: hypothetical protein VFA04_03465 [Bryobacteraceae bacterium]|nr:hypothetical protein [Bryobacteraceae bacterium]
MTYSHPSSAELSDFALHGLHICEHLRACDACRASLFILPAVRAGADGFDADPGWLLTIDGEQINAADSDEAAPIIAAAWRAQKSIQCRIQGEEQTVDWSAMLGLAARVNRILEAEGWQGEWWVPPNS